MIDAKGQELKQGDIVMIPCEVSIDNGELILQSLDEKHYCTYFGSKSVIKVSPDTAEKIVLGQF